MFQRCNMKNSLKFFILLIVIILFFRGFFYRSLISYVDNGTRENIALTNPDLINLIDTELKSKNTIYNLETIANTADKITRNTLKFSSSQVSKNPNDIFYSHKTNCVGYAAMFNSIANYIIINQNLQNEIQCHHKIGQLHLLGKNIHPFFDSPFFKDHDYDVILSKSEDNEIAIDPSVSDYLGIRRIRASN